MVLKNLKIPSNNKSLRFCNKAKICWKKIFTLHEKELQISPGETISSLTHSSQYLRDFNIWEAKVTTERNKEKTVDIDRIKKKVKRRAQRPKELNRIEKNVKLSLYVSFVTTMPWQRFNKENIYYVCMHLADRRHQHRVECLNCRWQFC